MVRNPIKRISAPDLEAVLNALADADCRTIIQELDRPMTASDLSDACDLPESTTYRKLDYLIEASLLEECTEIREDGHHTARYVIAFEAVQINLAEDRTLEAAVVRASPTADERLERLWTEVREETQPD